jgi:hypothetical protein
MENAKMDFSRKKRIKCIETGIIWPSLHDMCKEFDLNEQSVRSSICAYGKYSGYHFEILGK